jgi:hypothetical protein
MGLNYDTEFEGDPEFEDWLEAYGLKAELNEAFAQGLAELSPDLEAPFRRFAGLVCKVTCHDFFTLNYPPHLVRKCLRCGEIIEGK